jgi:hypothetical protein
LFKNTRALPLIEPVASQEVGLFWAEGEIVLPMANAFVSILKEFNKSGELQKRIEEELGPLPLAEVPRKLKRA